MLLLVRDCGIRLLASVVDAGNEVFVLSSLVKWFCSLFLILLLQDFRFCDWRTCQSIHHLACIM